MNAQPKLPKVFKRKWVEALRSGKFKQGTNQLYKIADDTYCCLGVARMVMHPDETPTGASLREDDVPASVLKVLDRRFAGYCTAQDKLINLNDYKRWSFKRIASYIERYF